MIEMLVKLHSISLIFFKQFRNKMKKFFGFFSDALFYKVFCNLSKTLIWKTEKAPTTTNGHVCISSGNKSVIYRGSSVEDEVSHEKGNAHKYKQFV